MHNMKYSHCITLIGTDLRTNQEDEFACRNESHLVSGLRLVSKRQVNPVEQLCRLVHRGIQGCKRRHVLIFYPTQLMIVLKQDGKKSASYASSIQWRQGLRYKYFSDCVGVFVTLRAQDDSFFLILGEGFFTLLSPKMSS